MIAIPALAAIAATLPAETVVEPVPKRIQKIIAKADGMTAETAFKVASIDEEYRVLQALRLQPRSQALVVHRKKPYDVMTVTDETGAERQIWFDISRFYPMF